MEQTTTAEMEKEAVNWLGELAIIHADGNKTNNAYSLIELYATKEGEVPWHIHHREDESFYVLDGQMSFYVGDKVYHCGPGDFAFAPKGISHRYSVDSPGHVRVMITFSPAGFEDFVRATSTPAPSMVPPTPTPIEMDFEELAKLAAQYGAEFVEVDGSRS